MIKNLRVTGKNDEIMKLQRTASLDQRRPLLGPIQPDLTGEKVTKKKIFP